ncbi:MAG: hypothetical protein EBR94_07000 [Bacteroidetes bacterium]|nr:hypothetical protein [Bacteroidota bacterium]
MHEILFILLIHIFPQFNHQFIPFQEVRNRLLIISPSLYNKMRVVPSQYNWLLSALIPIFAMIQETKCSATSNMTIPLAILFMGQYLII